MVKTLIMGKNKEGVGIGQMKISLFCNYVVVSRFTKEWLADAIFNFIFFNQTFC